MSEILRQQEDFRALAAEVHTRLKQQNLTPVLEYLLEESAGSLISEEILAFLEEGLRGMLTNPARENPTKNVERDLSELERAFTAEELGVILGLEEGKRLAVHGIFDSGLAETVASKVRTQTAEALNPDLAGLAEELAQKLNTVWKDAIKGSDVPSPEEAPDMSDEIRSTLHAYDSLSRNVERVLQTFRKAHQDILPSRIMDMLIENEAVFIQKLVLSEGKLSAQDLQELFATGEVHTEETPSPELIETRKLIQDILETLREMFGETSAPEA